MSETSAFRPQPSDIFLRMQIKEILAVGMYKQEKNHIRHQPSAIRHLNDQESRKLLEEGHKEIAQSECYLEYGYPSYIER